MSIRNYQITKELGRGSFGVTYLGYDTKNGRYVAVKTINIEKSQQAGADLRAINDEIETLKDLSGSTCSKYMACYYESFEDIWENVPTVFIISEYIDGGSLTEFITQNAPNLGPGALWPLYVQLLLGLKYIHEHGYAHRDIKPDNIMITEDYTIKYIDFGFACMSQCRLSGCTNVCRSGAGTLLYLPPEFFLGKSQDSLPASQAHDIWSLSMVMFELANGAYSFPYDTMNPSGTAFLDDQQIMNNIANAPSYSSNYQYDDGRTNQFLASLVINDWKLRPTIKIASELLVNIVLSRIF